MKSFLSVICVFALPDWLLADVRLGRVYVGLRGSIMEELRTHVRTCSLRLGERQCRSQCEQQRDGQSQLHNLHTRRPM